MNFLDFGDTWPGSFFLFLVFLPLKLTHSSVTIFDQISLFKIFKLRFRLKIFPPSGEYSLPTVNFILTLLGFLLLLCYSVLRPPFLSHSKVENHNVRKVTKRGYTKKGRYGVTRPAW